VTELVASYNNTPIRTQDELEALLDEVAAQTPPSWLELILAPVNESPFKNTVMNIGLGRTFSSLSFYNWGSDGDGNRYDSTGTLDAPQDADFDYGGTPTSMRPGSAIEVGQARAAVAEFLKTGRRPDVVAWTLFDPEYKEPEPFNDDDWEEFDPEA